jgi:hypothetical protein
MALAYFVIPVSYETRDKLQWESKYFFAAGWMPAFAGTANFLLHRSQSEIGNEANAIISPIRERRSRLEAPQFTSK